jgi:hypothetical protein
MLSIGFNNTNAQHTFFIKIPAFSAYDPDVFEDEKGCIIAKYDYGLTRINPDGRILWQTSDKGLVKGACIADSQHYIFPSIASEMGGFAVQAIDYKGKTNWLEYEEITQTTRLRTIRDFIIDSTRKQYIVAGDRAKVEDVKNLYYWIAGLDYKGHILWEREWRDSGASRFFTKILKNKKTGGYMVLTQDFNFGLERKELFSVDSIGQLLERNYIEPNPCNINPDARNYRLKDLIVFNDTMFLVTLSTYLSSDCPLKNGNYFYIYNANGKLIKRLNNDWAVDLIKQTKDKKIVIGAGNFIGKLNTNFELEWAKEIFPEDSMALVFIEDFAQSKDGGYFGIAGGYRAINNNWSDLQYVVYVFKTDSLGNINQKEEYKEKLQPVMLQPNPANSQVRIAIPYYYGSVTVEFYNMLGVFLYKESKNEQDMYDISSLSPGLYIVKARIEETGELRTMRLIVQ